MKDLTFGTNAVSYDRTVAKAWGLSGMAHFSTVCTTLGKITAAQVEDLATALETISQPWLKAAMAKAAGPDRNGLVVIDVDLTGQRVGADAKMPGTAFGYMEGRLAKGYQIAAAMLATSAVRLAIASTLKLGNSRSVNCLFELLPRMEAQIGRPRRLVEHVETRIRFLRHQVFQWQKEVDTPRGKGAAARSVSAQRLIESAQAEIDMLEKRHLQYLRESAEGFSPYRIVLRADSAFGTPEALRLCLEMGYEILMKCATGAMYTALFDAIPEAEWSTDTKSRQVTQSLSLPQKALPTGFELRQIGMRHRNRAGKVVRAVLLSSLAIDEFPLNRLLDSASR